MLVLAPSARTDAMGLAAARDRALLLTRPVVSSLRTSVGTGEASGEAGGDRLVLERFSTAGVAGDELKRRAPAS